MAVTKGRRYITAEVAAETARGLDLIRELKGFEQRGEVIDWLVGTVMLIPGTTVAEAASNLDAHRKDGAA